MSRQIEAAVKAKQITAAEATKLIETYQQRLRAHLENNPDALLAKKGDNGSEPKGAQGERQLERDTVASRMIGPELLHVMGVCNGLVLVLDA